MKETEKTIALDFDWVKPIINKQVKLTPKRKIKDWDEGVFNAYLSSFNNNLSINGGKIAVYKSRKEEKSGYLLVDGYDELNRLFKVEDLNIEL